MKGKAIVVIVSVAFLVVACFVSVFLFGTLSKPGEEMFTDLPPFLRSCDMQSSSKDRAGDDEGYSALFVCSAASPNWRETLLSQMPTEQGWEVDQEYIDFVKQRGLYEEGEFAYVRKVDGKLVARCHGGESMVKGAPSLSFRFKQFVEESSF